MNYSDYNISEHKYRYACQYKARQVVKNAPLMPFMWAKIIKANDRNAPTTLINWELYPASICYA